MRKARLLVPAVILASVVGSNAMADDAKVYYKDGKGSTVEFPEAGVAIQLNGEVQTSYEYNSYDDQSARGVSDNNNFDVNRARLNLQGSGLDGKVSFKLEEDFADASNADGTSGSNLEDAWIQFNNSDEAKVLLGQTKVPQSLQFSMNETRLQFTERSIATDEFAIGRQRGVMLHGGTADGIGYGIMASNGESEGEGQNLDGVDPNLQYSGIVTYSANGYDRYSEGDVKGTDGTAWTAGLGVSWGDGHVSGDQFDTTRVGADLGLKSEGLSAQGEFFFRSTDPDEGSSDDDYGFYVQAGYMVVPQEWEVAGRFAANYLEAGDANDDQMEYGAVVNRYLKGHSLKLQGEASFLNDDPDGGDSTTDFRFRVMATAYL